MAVDPVAPLDREQLDDLQPIGPECGRLLLHLLELNGWEIFERPGFGGGLLFIAERRDYPFLHVEAQGATLAEIACELVLECNRVVRPPAAA